MEPDLGYIVCPLSGSCSVGNLHFHCSETVNCEEEAITVAKGEAFWNQEEFLKDYTFW